MTREAAEALRLYIDERKRKYGEIKDSEVLFESGYKGINREERLKKPLTMKELERIVKEAARRAGIKKWKYVTPHCLRKTFQSFLRNQPSEVRLDIRDQEFLFGHILPGSMDPYFDSGKIEEMREKFSKLVFGLSNLSKKTKKVEQRIVTEQELESYLEDGWFAKFTLHSGKVIVEREVS